MLGWLAPIWAFMPNSASVRLLLSTELLDRIDAYRKQQVVLPSRSATVRMLLGIGLDVIERKDAVSNDDGPNRG